MKKLILFTTGFLPLLLAGQAVERQAITSGGTATVSVTGMQVSQTIGQVGVRSWNSSSLIVTEGYQQGNSNPTSVADWTDFASFDVFPNPMGDHLNLEIESSKALSLEVSLRDVLGRETPVPPSRLQVNGISATRIDCSRLAVGSYLLMIRDLKTGSLKSVTVQKVR